MGAINAIIHKPHPAQSTHCSSTSAQSTVPSISDVRSSSKSSEQLPTALRQPAFRLTPTAQRRKVRVTMWGRIGADACPSQPGGAPST